MRAALVIVVVLVLASRASADSAVVGRANGPWFAGASVHHVRDGREGAFGYNRHEQPTGWAVGLEAGGNVRPRLSVSVLGRFTTVTGDLYTDPGMAVFTERQLRAGPRIDLWPVRGRLRVGAAVVRSWRWGVTAYDGYMALPPVPSERRTFTSDNTYELHLGIVPVRVRGFELELSATYAREPREAAAPDFDHRPQQTLTTFLIGVGVRWRTGCDPREP